MRGLGTWNWSSLWVADNFIRHLTKLEHLYASDLKASLLDSLLHAKMFAHGCLLVHSCCCWIDRLTQRVHHCTAEFPFIYHHTVTVLFIRGVPLIDVSHDSSVLFVRQQRVLPTYICRIHSFMSFIAMWRTLPFHWSGCTELLKAKAWFLCCAYRAFLCIYHIQLIASTRKLYSHLCWSVSLSVHQIMKKKTKNKKKHESIECCKTFRGGQKSHKVEFIEFWEHSEEKYRCRNDLWFKAWSANFTSYRKSCFSLVLVCPFVWVQDCVKIK